MPSQPGSSNWHSQMPVYTPTLNWQPPNPSHPGDDGLCNPRPKRVQRPSVYIQSPFTSLPATTELPKKRVGRTKKNSKNDNLSPLNLGNAFAHDNVGGDDVLITGTHDTGIYFTYENVNPNKTEHYDVSKQDLDFEFDFVYHIFFLMEGPLFAVSKQWMFSIDNFEFIHENLAFRHMDSNLNIFSLTPVASSEVVGGFAFGENCTASPLETHNKKSVRVGEFSPPYYISQLGDSIIISGSFDFRNFRFIYAWALEVEGGFLSSCSMLFTIHTRDAAHLKGQYKGTNLIAVGMDGNNQIVSIAFGICKGETSPCWSWWMSVLKECIGDNSNLLFISDRHAAIALAVQNKFPLAYHAVCCRHLMMNLSLKRDKTKALFWKMCKAYTTEEFSSNMSHLQDIQPDAYDKLYQVVYRKLPVIKLAETYRAMVQDWYYKRRKLAGTCQCRKWQLSGLPCGHVIAVTRYLGLTDCVQFTSPPRRSFVGGLVATVDPVELEKFSTIQVKRILTYSLGYDENSATFLYLRKPNCSLDSGLVPLADALQDRNMLLTYAQSHQNRLHVYVSRVEISPLVVADQHKDEGSKKEKHGKPSCSKKLFD
ncbi:transposase, MuDR, MULE transposase domain protein [Tanacetum coccineum]